MPGNATLDTDILVDGLIPDIDELRGDLHGDFGVRPFRVYTVLRQWDGGAIGDGSSTDTEIELTPAPKVMPFDADFKYELRHCGLDQAGSIMLKEVSLSYTYEELTGKPVTAGAEGELPDGAEWLIKIAEGHGQGQPSYYFTIAGPPFPDREQDFGWVIRLRALGGA